MLKLVKQILLPAIPVILAILVINHTNYFDYERPIPYDSLGKITFENFRGLEFFRGSIFGNRKYAYVVTTIESDFGDNSVSIQTYFHPSRSFVYNKNSKSKELLKHEKYHIKITELFARKAKKVISGMNYFDKRQIEQVLNQTLVEEKKYQVEYDYNTFHSYLLGEQKRYEKEIDSLLNLLAVYKNPTIKFYEK